MLRRFAPLLSLLLSPSSASAVLFADHSDPAHNTAAPTGAYADSGWQYQGYYGGFLGTAIAPQYFITAQHIGFQGATFSQPGLFTGGASVDYDLDLSFNGTGYLDLAGSDLRVYKIQQSFLQWAELFTGDAVGKEAVFMGRGGVRGAALFDGPELSGFRHGPADGVARWGTNTIESTVGLGNATQLRAAFDDLGGGTTNEAALSGGDSGGGLFVLDGGVWKLAGVNTSVDGRFDTNNVIGDGSEFDAALFDRSGYYQGSDGGGWLLFPDLGFARPSNSYFASVAANAAAIQSVAVVPEAGSGLFLGLGLLFWTRRQRRP